jgi:hypothetical protein
LEDDKSAFGKIVDGRCLEDRQYIAVQVVALPFISIYDRNRAEAVVVVCIAAISGDSSQSGVQHPLRPDEGFPVEEQRPLFTVPRR